MYKYLLKRKIKNVVKNSERQKAYLNLKEIKSVMVLFDTENYRDAINFIQRMKSMGKKVKAFAYKDKKDTTSYSNITYTMMTEKDMKDLKTESLTMIVNSLGNKTFDLIVDLTLKENLLLLYLLVSANSPLKVGFYKYDFPVHDIVILFSPELVHGIKELGDQLIHYLTVISS
jgi:ribosomal protein L30/L7E